MKIPVRVYACPRCGRIETAEAGSRDMNRACLLHGEFVDLVELFPKEAVVVPPSVADLRARVARANDWWFPDSPVTELVHAVHAARIKMGTFQKPLCDPITREPYEPDLVGITLSEWQWIEAQRQTLAVLDFLIGGDDAAY